MKRLFLAGALAIAALGATLALVDGLSYRREVEYVDPNLTLGALPSVNIQNTRQSGWGGSLLEGSVYGPPFDLFIFGSLPADTTVTSVEARGLLVTGGGHEFLSVPSALLPLAEGRRLQGGVETVIKAFSLESRAFTSETPASMAVSATLVLRSAAGAQSLLIQKAFHLRRFRRLSFGSRNWYF